MIKKEKLCSVINVPTSLSFYTASSCSFDTLTKCSWYDWDKRNKTVLHIFMTNCLKPFAITFAGIDVDYKLAITVRNYLQANLQ
jgi:hypothetical protein